MDVLGFFKNEFLRIVGACTLLKMGYDNLGVGRYYSFYLLKQIPKIKNEIDKKKKELRDDIKKELNGPIEKFDLNLQLPTVGLESNEIVDLVKELSEIVPYDPKEGRVSGCVYSKSKDIDNLMADIFPLLERSNPLHPDVFPGVRKMEAEIVNMCGNLMKSPNPSAGCFTSGGTESILLAMRCYKKIAHQSGKKGEIVLAKSAHAAYWKAAEYFNMDVIEIETINEGLSYGMLKNFVTKNSTVVIASAPTFNFGIVDELEEISDFCKSRNLYLHVDMCLGGFLIPFLESINCDFTIQGITSISMDTHKYGYGPKGGSVLLYRDQNLFKKHCFVKEDWTGGIYGTSNLSGSRSGSVIGLTWATMMSMGIEGYQREALKIQRLTYKLKNAIKESHFLKLLGDSKVCLVAVESYDFNIYLLCDKLKDAGWCLNVLQNPPSFHFCITSLHTEEVIQELIDDINNFTEGIMIDENRHTAKPASIYGTTQTVNDAEIIDDVVREYICCLMELQ